MMVDFPSPGSALASIKVLSGSPFELPGICSRILVRRWRMPSAKMEALVTARTQAKKSKNFARADEIRKELAERGIVLEDTREGVRWKRK